MSGAGRVIPSARQFVRHFFIAPVRHRSGERHRLYGRSLRVHVRNALPHIDHPIGKRALKTRLCLNVKSLFRCAIFHVKSRPLFGQHIQIFLREKVSVNVYRTTAARSMSWH